MDDKELEAIFNETELLPREERWKETTIDSSQTYDLPLEFIDVETLTHLLKTTEKKLDGFGIIMHPVSSPCEDPTCRGQSSSELAALQEKNARYAYPFAAEGHQLVDVAERILNEVRDALVALLNGLGSNKKTIELTWEDLGISPLYNDATQSIIVDAVAEGSLADKAGITRGVSLRSFNTKKIKGNIELEFFVTQEQPGESSIKGANRNRRMIFETPVSYPNNTGLCEDAIVLRVEDTLKLILEALIKIAYPIGPVPDVANIATVQQEESIPTPILDAVSLVQMRALGFTRKEEFHELSFKETYANNLPFSLYEAEIGNMVVFTNSNPLPVRSNPGTHTSYLFGGNPNFEDPEDTQHLTPAHIQQSLHPNLCGDRNVTITRTIDLGCGDTSTYSLTGILDEHSNSFKDNKTLFDGNHAMKAGVFLYSPQPCVLLGENTTMRGNENTEDEFLPQDWQQLATLVSLRVRRAELQVNKATRNMYWKIDGDVLLGCTDPLHEAENARLWWRYAIPLIAYVPDGKQNIEVGSTITMQAVPVIALSEPKNE